MSRTAQAQPGQKDHILLARISGGEDVHAKALLEENIQAAIKKKKWKNPVSWEKDRVFPCALERLPFV